MDTMEIPKNMNVTHVTQIVVCVTVQLKPIVMDVVPRPIYSKTLVLDLVHKVTTDLTISTCVLLVTQLVLPVTDLLIIIVLVVTLLAG